MAAAFLCYGLAEECEYDNDQEHNNHEDWWKIKILFKLMETISKLKVRRDLEYGKWMWQMTA